MAQPAQITTTSVRITLLVKESSPATALSNDIALYSTVHSKGLAGLVMERLTCRKENQGTKEGGRKGKKNHV